MNTRTRIQRRASLALSVVIAIESLGGCASVQQTREQAQRIEQDARTNVGQSMPSSRPVVDSHSGAWLLGDPIAVSKPQPAILDKRVSFNVTDASTWSISDFTDWLASNAGVSAVIEDSARGGAAGAHAAPFAPSVVKTPDLLPMSPPQGVGAPPVINMPPLPSPPLGIAGKEAGGGALVPPKPLRYEGTVRGFLDLITGRAGLYWRYKDGAITIFKTETRTWNIPALPTASSSSGSISTSGGASGGAGMADSTLQAGPASSSGGSSGGKTSMSTSASVNYWSSLQSTAQSIAGNGSVAIIDKSFGTLTVTGTPPQLDRVNTWVNSLRSTLQKQVAIEVHVYNVKINKEDNYGLNLGLVVNRMYQNSGSMKITVTPAQMPSVVSSTTPMSIGAAIVGGTLDGTNVALQALSTMGKVTEVISRSGVTLNGQMLALQAAHTQNYLASSQTTLTSTSGSSTALQPGVITYGFTGTFLPKVVDGRIMIDLNMTLSNLLGISTFTSGGSSIQLPTLTNTTFQQSVALKSGQTLVLTGYRQQQASVTNNGVGSPDFAVLGGGVDAHNGDSILAVVINARTL